MRLLPCGSRAVLVELADEQARREFDAALRRARADGPLRSMVLEQVPAARTVLVHITDDAELASVATHLRNIHHTGGTGVVPDPPPLTTVPVRYDGADLEFLASAFDVTPQQVVDWHTGSRWLVDFTGFAPGFGYLVREQPSSAPFDSPIPRRAVPRTRIPAGAVALADTYTGVYPSASAGGWQLIGHTAVRTWDEARAQPALLVPGRRVQFVVAHG